MPGPSYTHSYCLTRTRLWWPRLARSADLIHLDPLIPVRCYLPMSLLPGSPTSIERGQQLVLLELHLVHLE